MGKWYAVWEFFLSKSNEGSDETRLAWDWWWWWVYGSPFIISSIYTYVWNFFTIKSSQNKCPCDTHKQEKWKAINDNKSIILREQEINNEK